jgi:hypothetical protein
VIQYSEGALRMSPDDFQATDSGITYGVKFRFLGAVGSTLALIVEKLDGDWISVKVIDDNVDANVQRHGGALAYAESVIRPAVKDWLAKRKLQPTTPAQEVAALVGKWQSL